MGQLERANLNGALTTELLGGAVDPRELGVDNLLDLSDRGVAEGFSRKDHGIHDLAPVRAPPAEVRRISVLVWVVETTRKHLRWVVVGGLHRFNEGGGLPLGQSLLCGLQDQLVVQSLVRRSRLDWPAIADQHERLEAATDRVDVGIICFAIQSLMTMMWPVSLTWERHSWALWSACSPSKSVLAILTHIDPCGAMKRSTPSSTPQGPFRGWDAAKTLRAR